MIGSMDEGQVMFDGNDRISLFNQPVDRPEQHRDISRMQPRGRLVEQVEGVC